MIDSAIRSAAVDKGVEVRLLIGWWKHSRDYEKQYLRSLVDISDGKNINISVVSNLQQTVDVFGKIGHMHRK